MNLYLGFKIGWSDTLDMWNEDNPFRPKHTTDKIPSDLHRIVSSWVEESFANTVRKIYVNNQKHFGLHFSHSISDNPFYIDWVDSKEETTQQNDKPSIGRHDS